MMHDLIAAFLPVAFALGAGVMLVLLQRLIEEGVDGE
jgi:hypothetical protein